MTELTRDEVNRYCHERIRGLNRLHDWDGERRDSEGELRQACAYCGMFWTSANDGIRCGRGHIPDYCSDDSPRSLLNEVVATVLSNGVSQRVWRLAAAISPTTGAMSNGDTVAGLMTATAEQIARAAVSAWEAREDGK